MAERARLPGATGLPERVEQLGARLGADEAVTDAPGEGGRLGTEPGDQDGGRLGRRVVDAGVADDVVLTRVAHLLTPPQLADDGDGLLPCLVAEE